MNKYFLLSLALLSGCGGSNPTPNPPSSPTPAPSPTPIVLPAISIQGNKFFAGGQPLVVKMLPGCCFIAPRSGWPVANTWLITTVKSLGGNFLHIRLGPHAPSLEGSINSAYFVMPDNRVDLNRWNPSFEALVDSILQQSLNAGLYVEVDLLDGWTRRTHNSAYDKKNNINGVDDSGCDALRRPLSSREKGFVEHFVTLTKKYSHITYQIGNETFLCKPTQSWAGSFINTIRSIHPTAIIGSNTGQPSSSNYDTFHSSAAPSAGTKPRLVNETKDEIVDSVTYCNAFAAAKANGTYIALWAGNRTESQLASAAQCWTKNLPVPTDEILYENGNPYLAKCAIIPGPSTSCECNKLSDQTCPHWSGPIAEAAQIENFLKTIPLAGLDGNKIVDPDAYKRSILLGLKGKYCAKFPSGDEVWVRAKLSNDSVGFDVVAQPATGGLFKGNFKHVVQCRPSAL